MPDMEMLRKLAPFMRRAGVLEVGRERLFQVRNRLACLLVTTDLSANSMEKVLETFRCPIFQCLTSQDIAELFGFQGTKIVGFRRSPLTRSVLPNLKPYRLKVSLPNAELPDGQREQPGEVVGDK